MCFILKSPGWLATPLCLNKPIAFISSSSPKSSGVMQGRLCSFEYSIIASSPGCFQKPCCKNQFCLLGFIEVIEKQGCFFFENCGIKMIFRTIFNKTHNDNICIEISCCFIKRKLFLSFEKFSFPFCYLTDTKLRIVMKIANKAYISKSSQNKISDSKDYIDANFKDTSLGVELLAEKAGMSNVYFGKLFKTQYHLSAS